MKPWLRIGPISLGWSHLVFAVVLLVRVCVLVRLASSPLFLPLRGDTHFYNDWAQRILRGEASVPVAFYGLPGYAYLLAFLYKIFGNNPFVPGLLQAGLDAGIAVLIYQLSVWILTANRPVAVRLTRSFPNFTARNYGSVVGVIAAMGWAVFVPAQAYSVILMPTVWFVFVFWFVVWRVVQNNALTTGEECLLLGLLIGLTATAVATILAIVPLIFAALLLRMRCNKFDWRVLVVRAAPFVAGIGIGTSPCWIHNYFVVRDPVFLSAHSGINFWIGNNPEANGYPRFPPGLRAGQAAMLQDSITQAESAAGHPLKRSAVSAYWSAKAKGYIVANFGDWLRLLALKLRNFWNAFQYDDLSIITNLREQGVILPGLYFGVVATLAVPGMLLAWWLAPPSRWIAAATLLSMFALLAVFVTERYRLVAVPGLLIFAAFGLSILWRAFAANELLTACTYLALLVGSAIFVALPQRYPSLWALDAYNSGWQALESNNLPLAETKLAIAYAYVSENAETNFALGNLRLAQGHIEQAQAFYHAVLAIDPHHKGALNNLGVISFKTSNFSDARRFFEEALVQAPRDVKAHYLLAKTFYAEANWPAAQVEIERAIGLNPRQPEFIALREKIISHSR